MGAVFFVVFMLLVLFVGVCILIPSVICTIVFSNKKRNFRFRVPLLITSVAVTVLSILVLIVPVGYFSFIVAVNTIPPADYVETDIVIDQDGYQHSMFTANGITYCNVGLEGNYDVCSTIATPVFSYKTSGFLNGSQCGNYYRLKNNQGFDLIWDGQWSLYCPEDQVEAVQNHYRNDSLRWFNETMDEPIPLSDATSDALNDYMATAVDFVADKTFYLDQNEYEELTLLGYSSDGIVLMHLEYFFFAEDSVYRFHSSRNYHDDVFCYTGQTVSDELEAYLLQLRATP